MATTNLNENGGTRVTPTGSLISARPLVGFSGLSPSISQAQPMRDLTPYQQSVLDQSVKDRVAANTAETPTVTTPSSGGGGSYGGGSSFQMPDFSAYFDQMMATLEAQRAQQEAMMKQQYENALAQAQSAYNRSVGNLNSQSDDALRQAYIAKMKQQKNVNQQLSNMGINGGATESILANLENSYLNDRNGIQKALQNNLEALGADYQANVANLGANYGGNYASLLDNYFDKTFDLQNNYANTLMNMAAKSANNTANSTANNNTEEGYSNNEIINAIKSVGTSNYSSLKRALSLYGIDIDSPTGKQFILQAGFNPDTLVNPNNNTVGSGITTRPVSEVQRLAQEMEQAGKGVVTIREMLREALMNNDISQSEYNQLIQAYRG